MEIQTVAIAIVALIALSFTSAAVAKEVVSATPALCEPGILDEMPQHIKKVCVALENSNQLSTALNAYIRNQAAALLYRAEDLTNANRPADKRTDVDHVFLRFGRRR